MSANPSATRHSARARIRASLGRLALLLGLGLGGLGLNACANDSLSPAAQLSLSTDAGEETETIAGDASALELEFTCPADHPDIVSWKPGVPPDDNGNGIVCNDFAGPRSDPVDDIVKDEGNGNGLAGAHGNFVDGGKIRLPDISFSFHGKQTGRRGEAKGEFEYHHVVAVMAGNPNAGPDLTVHGDVLCLLISANTARFIGVVTRSNDRALPVGQPVAWFAVDNGEGVNAKADRVTTLFPIKLGKERCDPAFKIPGTNPIQDGNIQVH